MLDTKLTKEDKEFLEGVQPQIERFVGSGEHMLEFSPMNGYRRRLVHKLGTMYKLNSQSVGEDNERFVCLIRTDNTCIPNQKIEFKVTEESKGPRSPSPNRRQDRPPRSGGGGGRGPKINMKDQAFYAIPGSRILLREDGSFGIRKGEETVATITERTVDEGVFKIINNQIICPGDDNWEN